jgi:integrase/recombinase XerD
MYESVLNEFAEYLRQKHISPKAVYEQLDKLRTVLARVADEKPLNTVTARQLEAIFRCLNREHYRCIATAARNVYQFFSFLVERGICETNPAHNLKAQNPAICAYAPTDDEIQKILTIPYEWTWLGLRNRTILELSCGFDIKIGVITKINIADADTAKRQIRLKNDMILQLSEQTAGVLEEYLPLLRGHDFAVAEDSPLFPNRNGERMSYHLCWTIIKNIIAKAGLARKLLPMDMRVVKMGQCGNCV